MLRYLTAGESHGEALVAYISGLPAGVPVDQAFVDRELWRRQQGYGRGGRMKIERDTAHILSGVRHGKTIGSPIAIQLENRDWKNWQESLPVAAGDADGASLYQYAVGKLVLWVPADSSLDVEHQGMNILLDPSVKKIAIANPQHAPYGRAALAAVKHAGLYDRIADRLVLGENVSQAAQFVESGNAQAGFVALAHAVAPAMRGKGKYWQVPEEFYPPLAQGAVVLLHSQHKKEAADFLEYIKTKESADLLRKYGFTLP